MTNVRMEVNEDKTELVIRVRLNERHGMSSSGKTQVVATTAGFVSVPGVEGIIVGLNVNERK